MIKRHAFLAVVVILTVVALAIPESRRVMGMQVRYLLHGRTYPPSSLMNYDWPEGVSRPIPAADASPASAWKTYMALAEIDQEHMLQHSARAMELMPDRPEAYVSAIMSYSLRFCYHRVEESYFASYPTAADIKDLDPKVGAAVLSLAESGWRVDPENALFDLIIADMLFGMHRDAEAVAMIRSAELKPRYDDYRRVSVLAKADYVRSLGLPATESLMLASTSMNWPLLGHDRVCRLGVWQATRMHRSGRSGEAEKLLSSVLRVGDLMCRRPTYLAGYIHGETAIDAIRRFDQVREPGSSTERRTDRHRAREEAIRRAGLMLREHEWPSLASSYEQTAMHMMDTHARMNEALFSTYWELPLLICMQATALGSVMLSLTVIVFLLATIAGFVLCVRRIPYAVPPMRWPARVGFVLLALCPWLILVLPSFAMLGGCNWYAGSASVGIRSIHTWNMLGMSLWIVLSVSGILWYRVMRRFSGGKAIMILITIVWVVALVTVIAGMLIVELPMSYMSYGALTFVLGIHAMVRGARLPRLEHPTTLSIRAAQVARQDMLLLGKALAILYLILLIGQLPFRFSAITYMDAVAHNEVQWLLSHRN